MLIVILGPDGCGKTTIQEKVLDFFCEAKGFETNYKILPRLAKLKRGDTRGHEDGAFMAGMVEFELSQFKAIIRMIWYLLDNWLGSVYWRKKMRVFGRYYYDYGYLRSYRMISLSLRLFFIKLAEKPDLLVVLKRKPEAIYSWKKELTIDEIAEQYLDITKMLESLRGQKVLVLEDMTELEAFRAILDEIQTGSNRFN